MSKSKTLWANQEKLSRDVRMANADLYLSSSGLCTISQETVDTINLHLSIIESDQFSSSTLFNPNTASEPKTPPYSNDSSSDDSSSDEENSPIDDTSNFPIDDNSFPMSDDDRDQENVEDRRRQRDKDEQVAEDSSAKVPIKGFSGQLLTDESQKIKCFAFDCR